MAIQLVSLPTQTEHLVLQEDDRDVLHLHVKLTESCLKAIEKSATVSENSILITFEEDGGYLVVPQNVQGTKTYEFSVQKGQQKGALECLHQWKEGNSVKRQNFLKTVGSISSRIVVKATDEVYETTREKAMQAEKEYKQSSMAQEIKLPQDRSGSKNKVRRPVTKPSNPSHSKPKIKMAHPVLSLRDRVVHTLAFKTYNRANLTTRLSKDKAQSQDFDNLDAVLQEVATLENGRYVLKKSVLVQINVDTWPLYGDAEKQVVRRNIARARSRSPDVTRKRSPPPVIEVEKPSPKCLLTEPPPGHGISPVEITTSVISNSSNPSESKTNSTEGIGNLDPPLVDTSNTKAVGKKKKKHKMKKNNGKHRESSPMRDKDCSAQSVEAVTDLPLPEDDFDRPITTPEERAEMKELFNKHHKRYLKLFEKVNSVVSEFTRLNNSLEGHDPGSVEYEDIHQQIRYKYAQIPVDFDKDKAMFIKLHKRLDSIKRRVVEYDTLNLADQESV